MKYRTKVTLHLRIPKTFVKPREEMPVVSMGDPISAFARIWSLYGSSSIEIGPDHPERLSEILETFIDPALNEVRFLVERMKGGWETPKRYLPSGAFAGQSMKIIRKWEWEGSKPFPRCLTDRKPKREAGWQSQD